MKRTFMALALFLLQIYLILKGYTHFGKLQTPFILFAVSALIPGYYLYVLLKDTGTKYLRLFSIRHILVGGTLGLLTVIIIYPSFRAIFDRFPDYANMSDVIFQLETLYSRFSNGIFPYYPLEQYPWHPYPVQMPLNWLPIGLAYLLKCDVRWIGVLFLAGATTLWGVYVWSRGSRARLLAVLLPALSIFAFVKWHDYGTAATFETLIAAYYLVLATGLASRNLALTTAGIVLCLLSRYTMIFWLPLFFWLLWINVPRRRNVMVWVGIFASIFFLYLLPFFFKDPTIFAKGLAYHNYCCVEAWNGLGHPEQATVFDNGLTFSWFIREYTSGPMAHRVYIGRMIQAATMLLLCGFGIAGYYRWRAKVNFYDYCLIMLYVVLLFFYMSSPNTFVYYYMSFLMVSAVVCGRLITIPVSVNNTPSAL